MNVIFAAISCLLIQYSALILPDTCSHRRYGKMALLIAAAVVAGISFYVSLSRLSDSPRYPWYWIAGIILGIFISNILVGLFVFNPTRKRKKGEKQ
ncbi:MAG TPA: hypothetical protein VMJ66_02545 [Geobacteraceae bacterium]|nr:hypothetical protein [Geobacteraceae bacterium]